MDESLLGDISTVIIDDQPTRLGRTYSVALTGMSGSIVEIEADIGQSLPGFTLLGLPDQSLQEAKDRIRSAARNSGQELTRRHLTVNLIPASLHKRGSVFDLGIAMAALAADCRIEGESRPVFLAALGLDGALRHAPGVLPAVMTSVAHGFTEIIVSEESAREARMVPGAHVQAFRHLAEVIRAFGGFARTTVETDEIKRPAVVESDVPRPRLDLSDVAGQHEARFALEIAAAGGHHLMLEGPPGAGKTMLAERLPSILPELSDRTALEATALRSVASPGGSISTLVRTAPFQAPHHSSTMASIIGGGSGMARPGAVSLAHGGVLFLDEAPEFDRRVLDALRQPLESRHVELHRSISSVTYPASFQLVLASNPCPCGWDDGTGRRCDCTSLQRRRYTSRLSGPLLDRIDIQVVVPRVTASEVTGPDAGETSAHVLARVQQAVDRQRERLTPLGVERNMELTGTLLKHPRLRLQPKALTALDGALDRGEMTARGYARVLRLAWTLADLDGRDWPDADEIDTAMNLRMQRELLRNGS